MKAINYFTIAVVMGLMTMFTVGCTDDDDSSPNNQGGISNPEEHLKGGQWDLLTWHETVYKNGEKEDETEYAEEGDYMAFFDNDSLVVRLGGNVNNGRFEVISNEELEIEMSHWDRSHKFDMELSYYSFTLTMLFNYWDDGTTYEFDVLIEAERE